MSDILHKYDWLITYFVYNSTFYELDEIVRGNGILDSNYFTMKNQTNYLFNLIEQLVPNDNVKIIIVNLDFDYVNKQTDFKIIEKEGYKLKIKNQLFSSINALVSANSIEHVLNTINRLYNFTNICVTTFGHGSLFGINTTSSKLYKQIKRKENSIDFDNIMEFNNFVKDNENLFRPSKAYETLYTKSILNISEYIIRVVKKKNLNSKFNKAFTILNKKLKNPSNIFIAERSKLSITNNLYKKAYEFVLKHQKNDDDIFERNKRIKILTNKEFSEGIENSSIKKVNVLVMYNCLMQNIYTQYEFRNCVDHIVAPVGGIGFPGFDYEGVYNNLKKDTSITSKELGNLYVTTIQTGKLQQMQPFKQNFNDRLFVTSVELNKENLETLKKSYSKWLLDYEDVGKEASYYNDDEEVLVVPSKQLSYIIRDTITTCFNVSSKCVSSLSIVDFYVFVNSFLHQFEKKDRLLKNKTSLVASTKNLIDAFSTFGAKTSNINQFYENETKTDYADTFFRINEPEKLGIGIIFNKYADDNLKFYSPYFGLTRSISKTIVPSFLEGTKTGELFLKS